MNRDEINKKILAKPEKIRSPDDILGPFHKYRDENQETYQKKRQQFLETANAYRKDNELALFQNRIKLTTNSDEALQYPFVTEDEIRVEETDGVLIRKRSERYISDKNSVCWSLPTPSSTAFPPKSPEEQNACCLEPWFRRYLVLNRFITAARNVVLRNRLLKNLEKLRTLNEDDVAEYEKKHRKFENVSYADVFEQFIE